MLIDFNDPQLEIRLRTQKQVYNQVRLTGEETPAKTLSLTDTGIRVGNTASMLQFYVEAYPRDRPAFSAYTQQAVLDTTSRPKFAPGATIYVKFDPNDLKQVAVDHTPIEGPTKTVKCPSCGATQTLTKGHTTCSFCGSPLMA